MSDNDKTEEYLICEKKLLMWRWCDWGDDNPFRARTLVEELDVLEARLLSYVDGYEPVRPKKWWQPVRWTKGGMRRAILEEDPGPFPLNNFPMDQVYARTILDGIQSLRKRLKSGEDALYEAYTLGLQVAEAHSIVDIQRKAQRSGGSKPKSKRGIRAKLAQIVTSLSPEATWQEAWRAFPTTSELVGQYDVWRDGDRVHQVDIESGREESIARSTFQQYFSTIKKSSRNASE